MKLVYKVEIANAEPVERFEVASSDSHDGEMRALVEIKAWLKENSLLEDSADEKISKACHELAEKQLRSVVAQDDEVVVFSAVAA